MWRQGLGPGVQVLREGRAKIRMQSLGLELEEQAAQSTKTHPRTWRPPDPPTLSLCSAITSLLVRPGGTLCWLGDLVIPSGNLMCGKSKHTVVYSGLI